MPTSWLSSRRMRRSGSCARVKCDFVEYRHVCDRPFVRLANEEVRRWVTFMAEITISVVHASRGKDRCLFTELYQDEVSFTFKHV